jgi:hypothetical protein
MSEDLATWVEFLVKSSQKTKCMDRENFILNNKAQLS